MRRRHALFAVLLIATLVGGCGGSTEVKQGAQAPKSVSLPSVTIQPIPAVTIPTTTAPAVPTPAAPVEQAPATPTASTPTASTPTASPADEVAVRRVVTDYAAAFVAGDGATACDLLTEKVRQTFLDAIGSSDTCATAFAKVVALQDSSTRDLFRNAVVGDVQVVGDAASASLAAGGVATPVSLARQADGWKITTLPAG
jgi:ketosteroid isomerase-like protein